MVWEECEGGWGRGSRGERGRGRVGEKGNFGRRKLREEGIGL
jgi:hypothetical protein